MKKYFYLIFGLAFFFFACKKKVGTNDNKFETIVINFNESQSVDIHENDNKIKSLTLEVTDHSLLTHIEDIQIRKNEIFVYDAHRVIVFDMDGKYIKKIGHRGQGPGEYTNINSFFFEGDNICLYDGNLQKLFVYDENDNFLETRQTKEMISSLYPIGQDKFIGKKKFQGDQVKVSTLAILDKKLELQQNIGNRFLTSGIGVFDYCYSFNNNILYWEFFNDTIYSIQGDGLFPLYYVDFQKYKIPEIEKKGKNISEIIEYINQSTSNYATGVRYVQEDSLNIRFVFTLEGGINYVKYDKQTQKASLYHIHDSTKSLQLEYFMKYSDGDIVLVVQDIEDEESNPKLLFISEEKI